MTNDDCSINPIERSLLTDLVGLYTCDLTRESHETGHLRCIPCSKEAIVHAISLYRELRAPVHALDLSPPPPFP